MYMNELKSHLDENNSKEMIYEKELKIIRVTVYTNKM